MSGPTVFVVDDNAAHARSLRWLIESVQLQVETYESAQEFLDQLNASRPGCLLLDVRMPGMSGLQLQERLRERSFGLPIIFITGHGDVQMAVRAIKSGAFDFVEKPFNDQDLLDRIQRAIGYDAQRREREACRAKRAVRLASLTGREREVLDLVTEGLSSKVIAARLGLSSKTVEAHRAKVMEKLAARSLADLVKAVLQEREAE